MSWWDAAHLVLLAAQWWFIFKAWKLYREANEDRKEVRQILDKLKAHVNYGRAMAKTIRGLAHREEDE